MYFVKISKRVFRKLSNISYRNDLRPDIFRGGQEGSADLRPDIKKGGSKRTLFY